MNTTESFLYLSSCALSGEKPSLDEVDFDVFVFGGDQKHPGFQALERWCLAHGKEMVRLPRTEGISSSEIKEFIRSL